MENVIDKLLRAQQELSGARKGCSEFSLEYRNIQKAMECITRAITFIENRITITGKYRRKEQNGG